MYLKLMFKDNGMINIFFMSARNTDGPRLLRVLVLYVTLRGGMAHGKAFSDSPVPVVLGESVLPTARSLNEGSSVCWVVCFEGVYNSAMKWRCF